MITNLIGQSLGRYHILEQLGEGGMAIVYKAYDTRLECHVAMKVILAHKQHTEKFLKRFEREARALAQLTHPNIVGIIDYGEYEEMPYLVMEYVPSGTLKHKIGKPIPYREASKMLAPIARALAYAHEQKIIHRDIKPANILITQSGEPMLSDFGIAKILEAEETLDLTGTGVGVGTPEYMAPEQSLSKPIDQRVDIYALGVVFYEMVIGRKPYQADTPLAVLLKSSSEPLPRPISFIPDLPEMVERVLLKALAKKPEDRFQNMSEFSNVLEKLAQGAKVSVGKVAETLGAKKHSPILIGILSGFAILFFGTLAVWKFVSMKLPGTGVLASLATATPMQTSTPKNTPKSTAQELLPTTVLFQDDFSTNSGRWEIFGPWKIQDGAFQIDVSGPDLPHAAAFTYPLGDLKEWNNFSYEADNMCESGGYFSNISLRQTEAGAYFLRLFWNDNPQYIAFGKNNGSGKINTGLRSQKFNLAYNHWYHLKVTAIDNHFWIYIDDQLVMEYIDNQDPLLYGGVVLGVYGEKEEIRCSFDNVKVVEETK